MFRGLAIAALLSTVAHASQPQVPALLRISVSVNDAEQRPVAVPNHALLISDDPPTAAPRRVLTRQDGTVDVPLRPGKYTIESDQPVAFQGKAYQWLQFVDIAAAPDASLELTSANAEVQPMTAATAGSAAPLKSDPALLLAPWQDSVLALWTPTTLASGFVVDPGGLVATSYRSVQSAVSIEVQVSPSVKVAGRVLVADPTRDVTILWVDPDTLSALPPVPLGCGRGQPRAITEGQQLFSIETAARKPGRIASGLVTRVEQGRSVSEIEVGRSGVGGPVFDPDGTVVGVISPEQESDDSRRRRYAIVPIDAVCEGVAAAHQAMTAAVPPSAAHLPVEPTRTISPTTLKDRAPGRAASLTSYQTSSSQFDLTFITPLLAYDGQNRPQQGSGSERSGRTGQLAAAARAFDPLGDYSNWSEYVADYPPVLLVRVTPKLEERFWTTVARGVARTQGVSLPPIKRFTAGFSRLRAFCGDAEVAPIHPFRLELRVSEAEAISEGLYVFHPDALTPECGTVKLLLYSEKEPEKGVSAAIDPTLLRRLWQDFAAYRELN